MHRIYAARFTFAHLALCAAAILLRPAAEIVRFGLALCFAHRAFSGRLLLRRPAANIVRDTPFELLPSAACFIHSLDLLLSVLIIDVAGGVLLACSLSLKTSHYRLAEKEKHEVVICHADTLVSVGFGGPLVTGDLTRGVRSQ